MKKISLFYMVLLLCSGMALATFATEEAHLGSSYSSDYLAFFYELAPSKRPHESPALGIANELFVTRPQKSTEETTLSSYFITGTSDPSQPLYFGNEEIERQGDKGTFGVHVALDYGANDFTFQQGSRQTTVTLVRTDTEVETTRLISEITPLSMVPSADVVYRDGDVVILEAIGPSGGSITATIHGDTVDLTQVAATEKKGIPATYRASYTLKGGMAKEVIEAGHISYTLTYAGKTSRYESQGKLYIAGTEADIKIQVSNYVGFIYPNINEPSVFKQIVKSGATDYVVDQCSGYYELASGGAIPAKMVDILTGNRNIENKLQDVKQKNLQNGEYFALFGNASPMYYGEIIENAFVFTMYNTTLKGDFTTPATPLFAQGTVEQLAGENTVVITLPFRRSVADYWGYNVVYGDDGVLFLEFEHKPPLSAGNKPLKNLSIVLDPGHGGEDSGAYGVAGEEGPTEADVNLAHAFALEKQLTALGATVYLTRYDDTFIDLDDRLRDFARYKVDLFLSIHHNSIAIYADANDAYGTESYYFTDVSEPFARFTTEHIAQDSDRTYRSVEQSYYRVTLLDYAPSILAELGFVSNPLEYEKSADPAEIERVAAAMTRAILKTLQAEH